MEFSHNSPPYNKRPSLKLLKSQLRERHLAERRAIPSEQKKIFDEEICKRIAATVSFRYATTVLVYSALPSEIDLSSLIELAYAQGKQVAFPRCIPGTPLMNFHLTDNTEILQKGSFSIMEPPANAPIWTPTPQDRAICIIPAVLFDKEGHRIGYGKGFYDRYLSDKQVQKIGVVYDRFIKDSIPHGRFDLSVDLVVTEKRLLSIKK